MDKETLESIVGPEVADEKPQQPEQQEQQSNQSADKEQPPAMPERQETVPYEAMAEERLKRKQLQERLSRLEYGYMRMLERMQQPEEEPEEDNFEKDPIGHLKSENEKLRQQIASVSEQVEGPRRQQQEMLHIQRQIINAETEFSKDVPDYNQAAEFVRTRRMNELAAMGLNQMEIQQTLAQDVLQLNQFATSRGMTLPALVYDFAKKTGYAKPAPEKPKPKAPSSLGGSSADTPDGAPTLEAISEMSDEEFNSFWEKFAKQGHMV